MLLPTSFRWSTSISIPLILKWWIFDLLLVSLLVFARDPKDETDKASAYLTVVPLEMINT